MRHILIPPTEEQICLVIELTKASRAEVLKAINLSKVNLEDIIGCLEKIKPVSG